MAQSTVQIFGSTKGESEVYDNNAGAEAQALFNSRGDHLTAQSLPPYAEVVRMGNTWTMRTATASAFNLVAALPTTLAVAVLHNGEASGGRCYVIHSIFVTSIVTTAALTSMSLLAQVLPNAGNAATAPTHSAATTLITNRSGSSKNYDGLAKRAVNVTTFLTDLWEVVGTTAGSATASIATGVYADIGGGIIIPPGGALGMNVIAGTVATASGIIGCTWTEVQLALG